MEWLNKVTTGVDIGARTIKAVHLKKRNGKVFLENAFLHDLSFNNEHFPLESHVEEKLAAVAETREFKKKKVSANLSVKDILAFELKLPKMPEKELIMAIANEAEEKFGRPSAELYSAHTVLGKTEQEGQSEIDLRIYSSRRDVIKERVELLKKADLIPVYLEPNIEALTAMLAFNGYITEKSSHILIDIGETHISIALIGNGKIVQTGSLHIGLGAINQALFKKAEISYTDAEFIKFNYSLKAEQSEENEIISIIDEIFYEIFYKTQRLSEYYKTIVSTPIENILVTGGGSQIDDLPEVLGEICALKVEIANPFRNIELYQKGKPEVEDVAKKFFLFSGAVGLALRGVA